MSKIRRNTITHDDNIVVTVIAVIAGVLAAFSAASPTGATITDIVVVVAGAAAVTWLGASAPWWALMVASGVALIGAHRGPLEWMALAAIAFGASCWIGWNRANQPIVRSVIAGAVIQIVLRLEWNEFFFFSGLIATLAVAVIVITGFMRRRKHVRKRIRWGGIAVVALAGFAVVGLGIAAGQSRTAARDGYVGLLDGLEFLQDGRVVEAQASLQQAATDLDTAADALNGPLTQPARLVPAVAQNRNAGADVLTDAAAAAESAANTLLFVDLDQLTIDNGVIDIAALAALEAPLADLADTVESLSDTLVDARSGWLVRPARSRLDIGIRRADQATHQAVATAAAARVGPELLGIDAPRTYLLAFVNNAEARGTSGLMGSWSELTIDNGRLSVSASGRTADLQTRDLYDFDLDVSDEYLDRYSPYGAGFEGGTSVKYWSNVTIPADMPSVGDVMAQMYEVSTGRSVDGVFVIDPAGIAGLMAVTGPVELSDIGQTIDSGNAQEFLTLGQYEFAENEREDLLTAVTSATVDNVLQTTLPAPQQVARLLAPSVLNGHISGWATQVEEQELFELVGMDAALPAVDTPGTDAIAAVSINRNANKIDSFLERTIEYRPVVDERTGLVRATLTVTLENTAPTTGYEDYVIANRGGLPVGSNRSVLDISTRLGVDTATIDGQTVSPNTLPELGYNVHTSLLVIPPGETVVVELELAGDLGPGEYELVYRPQPLPTPDTLIVDAQTTDGDTIFEHNGMLERRSVIGADGVRAWR